MRRPVRTPGSVVPAQAGTQEVVVCRNLLDSRLRGNDVPAVVPAQAGTQKMLACGDLLDSRLRGNDGLGDSRLRANDGVIA